MLVGYMRVSSADDRQSVDLPRDALIAAPVDDPMRDYDFGWMWEELGASNLRS